MSFASLDPIAVNAAYDVFGMAAVYNTTATGDITCNVIVDVGADVQPDGALYGARSTDTTMRVRTSEIPTPARGATVIAGEVTYTVDGYTAIDAQEWLLNVRT